MSSRPLNPNVKLPRALQARVEEGEAAFAEAYPDQLKVMVAGETGGGDDPPPASPPPERQLPGEPGVPLSTAQAPPVDNSQEPPAQVTALQDDELKKLKQAHQTLQGKYNKELSQANGRIGDLTEMITRLTAQVALLQAQPAQPAAPPPPDLDAEMADKLDPELIGFINAKLDRMANPLKERLKAADLTIKSLEAQLGQVRSTYASEAKETLASMLDRDLPGWQEQNDDSEFMNWLKHATHPATGLGYQVILDNAVKRKDTSIIGMVFRAYPGSALAQPTLPPAPQPNPPLRETKQVALDTLAQPPRGRRAAVGPSQPEGIITADQLRRFDADVTRGRYRNDPAGRAAIEALIDKAIVEHRFVPQQRH